MNRYLALTLFCSISLLSHAKEMTLSGSVEVKINPTDPTYSSEELIVTIPQYQLSPHSVAQLKNKLE